MDWEQWLRQSVKRSSDNEDAKRERTEKQIRDALSSYRPLQGRDYVVYTKGSYANNTNVRLDYDVDIAVEYRGFFYYDLMFDLAGEPKSVAKIVDSTETYARDDFKRDIKGALEAAFGKPAIESGSIAYRVREQKTTLPADVVPCWEYRRYERIESGKPVYQQGTRVYTSAGASINNFPAQQLANGIAKNDGTNRRYKRMARALKRLENRLVINGSLKNELPSFLMECLVYNVPDEKFGHSTYKADMREVLATIFNETLLGGNWENWEEVNGLKYLFRPSQKWTREQAHQLADAAWDEIGFS